MFVSGVELGFWPGDFGFLGAKSAVVVIDRTSQKCLNQLSFTMLNTVLLVFPYVFAYHARRNNLRGKTESI